MKNVSNRDGRPLCLQLVQIAPFDEERTRSAWPAAYVLSLFADARRAKGLLQIQSATQNLLGLLECCPFSLSLSFWTRR